MIALAYRLDAQHYSAREVRDPLARIRSVERILNQMRRRHGLPAGHNQAVLALNCRHLPFDVIQG